MTDQGKFVEAMDEDVDFLDEFVAAEVQADPQFAEGVDDIARRKAIVRQLIARRKDLAVTQASVAESMGTTQSAVSELESGGTDPFLSTLQRYAMAVSAHLDLGVTFRRDALGTNSAPSRATVFALTWERSPAAKAGREAAQKVAQPAVA